MNIKTLALTAALAVAAVTSAHAANDVKNGKFENGFNKWSEVGSSIGSLNGSAAAHLGTDGAGLLTQSIKLLSDSVYKLSFDFSSVKKLSVSIFSVSADAIVWSRNLVAGIDGTFTAKNLNLTAGNYILSFSSKNAFVDNVSLKSTVAVPGPEAGAGLGALAMGGAAFWMSRRRRDAPTAA